MRARTAAVAAGAPAGLVTLALAFVVGMRTRTPAVVDGVRRANRAVFNPLALRTAGAPGARASVIRHTGRRSGATYATPVGAVATDDGFVIALPYGPRTDWVANVLASGSAEIVHDGHTYLVERPEVVDAAAVAEHFAPRERRAHRWFGVDRCLRLRRAATR